jgi:hypothetical protein
VQEARTIKLQLEKAAASAVTAPAAPVTNSATSPAKTH